MKLKNKTKQTVMSVLSVLMVCSVGAGVVFMQRPTVIAETLPSDESATYVENYTDQDNVTGVKITVPSSNATAKFEYWNLLTVDQLATGFTIKLTPADYAVAEASNMKIFMEDAVDETNQIIATAAYGTNWYGNKRVYGHTTLADDVYFNNGYCIVKDTSQYCFGNFWEAGLTNNTQGCAPIGGDFTGNSGVFHAPKELPFRYSNGLVEHQTGGNKWRIMSDLKDEAYQNGSIGSLDKKADADLIARYTNEYVDNLFPSGMVRLKFEFGAVSAKNFSFMITNVGGEAVTKVEDKTAPMIVSEYTTNALVGETYTLPDIDITDLYTQNIKPTVTLKTPSGNEGTISGNTFVPTETGDYTIVVTAVDDNGNTATKQYIVTCFDEKPQATFVKLSDTELAENYIVYETMHLPIFECRSDLSKLDKNALPTTVKVTKNDVVVWEQPCDAEYDYKIEEVGDYTILYIGVDEYGNEYTYTYKEFSALNVPYIEKLNDAWINVGKQHTPKALVALYEGNEYKTTYEVYDANGTPVTLTNGGFTPNAEADYTVKYTATVDGKTSERTQALYARYLPSGLWEADKTVTFTEAFEKPSYFNEEGTGLYVKTTAASSLKWTQIIDLSKLSPEDDLVRFFPYFEDGNHIGAYTITLTDIYNAKNTVTINLIAAAAQYYQYVNISYDGRRLARYEEASGAVVRDWPTFGYTMYFGKSSKFSLQCNYAEKQFFVQNYWMLLDLDDGSQVGFGKEWGGFTTGEVYMEMTIAPTAKETGVVFTHIAGTSMAGYSMEDTTAPNLYFTKPQGYTNVNGKLPDAQVNKAYPLVTATAHDTVFGDCDVEYTIYYNGETKNLYTPSLGASFVPTKAGTYTYIISSVDKKGNKASWTGEFTAYDALNPMSIELGTYDEETLFAGGYFRIPTILTSGGSGNIQYTYKLLLGGNELVIEDCGDVYLGDVGALTFVFDAVDYVGTSMSKDIVLQVYAKSSPIIDVKGVPHAVVYGTNVTLPDFTAIDYNYAETESGYNAYKCLKVNGNTIYAQKGSSKIGSLSVDVTEKGVLTVEYCAGNGANDLTTVEKFVIPVIETSKNADYILPIDFSEDCVDTAVTEQASEYGVAYIVDGDKAFTTLHPVASSSLTLTFSGISGKASQKYMDIVLTDYHDARNAILFRITKISGAYYVNINGMSARNIQLAGSMETLDSYITLTYSDEKLSLVTSVGDEIKIEKNLMGNTFTGFDSGLVRVNFELHEVSKEASINIYQIGNQVFTAGDRISDNVGPQIWSEKPMKGQTMTKGDTLTISKAYAQDVLCGDSEVTLTVRGPKGVVSELNGVAADKDYSLTLTDFGYYTVLYTATDSNGNKATLRYNYYCKDEVAPTVNIDGSIPKTAKVSEELVLPTVTCSDNYSECNVSVMIIAPNGRTTKLSESYMFEGYEFTPIMAGTHYVVYYVTDADYNITTIRQQLEVR